ncbi:MAG: hypothetical protein M3N48_10170 [Verrucomicrobiota bacterium]|nr:hypothetical protein [Verrucomicrobiota bacterium]
MLTARQTLNPQDKFSLLNCRRLPARLNNSETALLLGVHDHDIAPLVAAKLLHPLGKPAPNAPKYFAAVDVLMRADDREWLSDATKALARHWQAKNSRAAATNAGRCS